jgi:demethylmenaquinone methyltransferase/2-methoxy-6-polyprenyl-1,4-benzoquinol methylase
MPDVAIGTGLVAREEVAITGDTKLVLGLDPSIGMIQQARRTLNLSTVLAVAEELPLAEGQFDFLSMGYALRHLSDLSVAFREFHRVLKPGGRLCILEISRPRKRLGRVAIKAYLRWIVPGITRLLAERRADSQLLWEYYWDTIEACMPPDAILGALEGAGFRSPARNVVLGMFSQYVVRKPE